MSTVIIVKKNMIGIAFDAGGQIRAYFTEMSVPYVGNSIFILFTIDVGEIVTDFCFVCQSSFITRHVFAASRLHLSSASLT